MLRNWEEFNQALREVAVIDLEIDKADHDRQKAILTANTTFDVMTKIPKDNRQRLADDLEAFYKEHRKEVEKKGQRSIECYYGVAGMRKGAPKLATRKGWTWATVLTAAKEQFGKRFIKITESVDKQALKKAKLGDAQLEALGLRMSATERFFFETYPEKLEPKAA